MNNERLLKYIHPDCYTADVIDILDSLSEDFDSFEPIPPKLIFTKKYLSLNEEYKWVKECNFNLICKEDLSDKFPDVTFMQFKKLDDFCVYLDEHAKTLDPEMFKRFPNFKYVGIDTETNTLNKNVSIVGGKKISNVYLAGLCIAIDEYNGFYIPINNNELDGVSNYDYDTEVKPFLQALIDKYFQVWHNANYDLSVCRNNGIVLNDNFTDTEILGKITCKFEYEPYPVHNSLKQNAAFYLKRPMVELHELLGGKQNINFNRLSAVDSYFYGSSDAMNTIGLFKLYTDENFKLGSKFKSYERNPFIHQSIALDIAIKCVRATIAKTTMGLPIDYKSARDNLLTILRRIVIIEDKFSAEYEPNTLNSDEKVGIYLGNMLSAGWTGDVDKLSDLLMDKFGMSTKSTTLKSGETKRTYSTSDEVMQKVYKNLDELSYLTASTISKIRLMIEYITAYRSLSHEFAIYVGIIRNINYDDRGYAYINFGLRQEGTDTGRFANSKGSGLNQIRITSTPVQKKIKTNFVTGDGNAFAINSQGINRNKIKLVKCKKIVSMPSNIYENLHEKDFKIMDRYRNILLTAKATGNK